MQRRSFISTLAGLSLSRSLPAQGALTLKPLADKLHLLAGAGGNIAVLESPEGLLLVDTGVPEAIEGILAETGKIGRGRVMRIINTHWHFDHCGGNARLGRDGARILAHVNVKRRLSTKQFNAFLQRSFGPEPAEALPVDTFKAEGKLRYGNETLHYWHLPPAHTDGDTVIRFQYANVFHAGDLVTYQWYPFIDYSSGGSLAGMAANAERIWKDLDNKTKVIPGHGPLCGKKEVKEYATLLAHSLDVLTRAIKAGQTLEQIQAARPFSRYDPLWGDKFLKPEQWIAMNYVGMKK